MRFVWGGAHIPLPNAVCFVQYGTSDVIIIVEVVETIHSTISTICEGYCANLLQTGPANEANYS